ncbi:MAG: CPBP family intramembrane metalloprotease [Candidatus Dormibacteraeota bacterium]|nr:CPBP family intramembrane metalloprotease [Candidatus Dormibacteraeota bacterium]
MGALALAPARRLASRVLPIDAASPLDATALGLTLVVAGSQIGLQVSTNVLATVAAGTPETPLDQVLTELPFLLGAVLGVGLGLRRGPRAVVSRLGFTVPRGWQILLGIACAGAFYAFGLGADALQRWLTPDVAAQVGSATRQLYRGIDNPVGVATIALVPAICEETLFRGALQPRLGMIWTAIVFALLHTQYGFSIDELAVLILAFGLGALRRFTNTTTSMLCHAVYNGITAVQVASILAGPGLALEGIVVASAAIWFAASRHRAGPSVS